jgi:hypothetical protein
MRTCDNKKVYSDGDGRLCGDNNNENFENTIFEILMMNKNQFVIKNCCGYLFNDFDGKIYCDGRKVGDWELLDLFFFEIF